jgi:hypothetical protein
MSYVAMDARPVDFILCQYENSKNLFRGPKKILQGIVRCVFGGGLIHLGGRFQIPLAA